MDSNLKFLLTSHDFKRQQFSMELEFYRKTEVVKIIHAQKKVSKL